MPSCLAASAGDVFASIGFMAACLAAVGRVASPVPLQRQCHPSSVPKSVGAFAQAIYTFWQGRAIDRNHEAQQYRASGLNLVIAAIVYWNSNYMADAVAHLRAQGEIIPDDLLTHTSPVGWEHIAFSAISFGIVPQRQPTGNRSTYLENSERRESATLAWFSGKPAQCPQLDAQGLLWQRVMLKSRWGDMQ